MTDQRSDVPMWAWLNGQIIQEAFAAGELAPAIARVEKQYAVSPGTFSVENVGYLLSLLYCLIVVPKQLWLQTSLPPELASLDPQPILDLFRITQGSQNFDTNPLYRLLRHLRNSIAHVRFSIDDSNRLMFWDQYSDNHSIEFKASISLSDLMKFLSRIGPLLANLRNAPTVY
jgi:hypothetical protein